MRVLTVIVNFRTAEMTLEAVAALVREMEAVPGAAAVVVDNDSGDGSFERLLAGVDAMGASDRVRVVQSGHNGGFGYGLNHAVRVALASDDPPDAIYLLNSDAFLDPGSLPEMLDFQAKHPEAAILGNFIHGPEGEPHCTSFRFPTVWGELIGNLRPGRLLWFLRGYEIAIPWPENPRRVDWVAGASMLIRRDVFERIGLFDEGYFLYYEETDFCRRAADAGFQTWYAPAGSVTHIGGASTGFKSTAKPRATYWFESRRRYFLLHHGSAYLQATNLVWVISFVLWQLRRRIQRIPDQDPPRLLRDFLRRSFKTRLDDPPRPETMVPVQAGRRAA